MTNADRRISYLNKITDAPGEALSDAEIICRFAQKMGYNGFGYTNSAEIFAEHCSLTEGSHIDISGLSYDILKKKRSVQWPYLKNTTDNGTARFLCAGNKFDKPPTSLPPIAFGWPVNENGPAPGFPICPVIKLRLMRERFLFTPITL